MGNIAIKSGIRNVSEDTTPQLGGDLDVNSNSIVSASNGDINITPNGTGSVVLDGLSWPQADGTADYVLKTDGAGQLSWTANTGSGLANVVDDTTPQLGGQLDVNGQAIGDGTNELLTFVEDASAVNHVEIENEATGSGPIIRAAGDDTNIDLNIAAKGTGNIAVGNFTLDGDQTVGAGQDNYVLTYDNATGLISLEVAPGAGGGISNVVEDTTPQLGGQLDVNGNALGDGTNELLTFTEDASAVNHVNIENEATGGGPIISAAGDDANIDLNLNGKATGNVILRDGTDVTKTLSVELAGATTGTKTTLTASQTADRTVTLPDSTGTLATLAGTETLTNKTLGATTLSGDIDADGNNIDDSGVLFQREQASADADVAGQGQWWTQTATPNRPMFTDDTGQDFELLEYDFGIAASDESTALTASTSTAIATFHAQRDCVLEEVLIGVTTAPTGSTLTADVHLNGTTIFSTKPTIDATEKTSVTAATAAVLSTTAVSKGDLIELFADSVGSTVAGAGLKFYFNGYRS